MGENFQRNLDLVARIEELAARRGITASQLALAWVLSQGEDIVPIPGTRHRARLEENVRSADIELSPDEVAQIAEALPRAAGSRYSEAGMQEVGR